MNQQLIKGRRDTKPEGKELDLFQQKEYHLVSWPDLRHLRVKMLRLKTLIS